MLYVFVMGVSSCTCSRPNQGLMLKSSVDMCPANAAGDETLRFWNVLPGPKSQGSVNDSSMSSMMRTLIR